MFVASRRNINPSGLWSLFGWFGHSCDQAAGVLLNPVVVVVYGLSIQSDIIKLSYLFAGFGVAWILGAGLGPLLQRMTVRVMPWVVGGYIVRTAAVALLAYSAADRSSPSDQRYRSALICFMAYAAATGIARSAEARHLRVRPSREPLHLRSIAGTVGAAIIVGFGAWAMWSILSSEALPWSRAFGRLWSLAAVALGVATLAAIKQGLDATDTPRTSRAHEPVVQLRSRSSQSSLILVALGLGSIAFVEAASLVTVFADFRRNSIVVRGSLAFFAAGWILGMVVARFAANRYTTTVILQCSIGFGALSMVAALALRDVSSADWFPTTIDQYRSVTIVIYVMAGLIGLAVAARRTAMAELVARQFDYQRPMIMLVSIAAAASPVLVALLGKETSFDWLLIAGILISLFTLMVAGTMSDSGPVRRAGLQPGQLSPATLSRR